MKILAIAPITKRLGAAAFENAELIYFAVATIKSNKIPQSPKIKIAQTLRKLISKFEPDLVVVKTLNKQQEKSKNLKTAIKQIKSEAETAGIQTEEVSFNSVRKLLCADDKATKANVFKALAKLYPELRRFLHQPNKWQKEYYDAMLSAVAIGFYCQKESVEPNQCQNQNKPE